LQTAVFTQAHSLNNRASRFFQGIRAAWLDDRKRKLSAGIAVSVRQRTAFINLQKLEIAYSNMPRSS
jgi:hypothetical protein